MELYDLPDVRKHAESANRVSDYLGHMWRKGEARRSPAPKHKNNDARYAYEWNWGSEVNAAFEPSRSVRADSPAFAVSPREPEAFASIRLGSRFSAMDSAMEHYQ